MASQEAGNRFAPLGDENPPPQATQPTGWYAYDDDLGIPDFDPDDVEEMEIDGSEQPGPDQSKPVSTDATRVVDSVPKDFAFKERSTVLEDPYLKEIDGIPLDALHKEYRMRDRPDLTGVEPLALAEVHFMDAEFRCGKSKSQFLRSGELNAENKDKSIRVSFMCDTQMPSVKIHVQRDGGKGEITYQIFANCIRLPDEKAKKPAGIQWTSYASEMSEEDIKRFSVAVARGYTNLTKFVEKRCLLRLRLTLLKPEDIKQGSYYCRPVWSGMKVEELRAIQNKAADTKQAKSMTPFERAVYRLDKSVELSIFRHTMGQNVQQIQKFKDVFMGSMLLSIRYRNFWHYQLQLGSWKTQSIFKNNTNLKILSPPRWIVSKWLVTLEKDKGPITKLEPLNWAAFNMFPVYPSPKDCAFVIRLALARERQHQQNTIGRMQAAVTSGCSALFKAIPSFEGGYMAYVSLPSVPGVITEVVKPEIDTRVEINVSKKTSDDTLKLQGSVVESTADEVSENESKDFDFTVQLTGPSHEFSDQKEDIFLDFLDDTTSANRAHNATISLADAHIKRTDGVDLQAVIFRSAFTIDPANQGSLGQKLGGEEYNKCIERLSKVFRLNEQQKLAVSTTLRTTNGLSLIYGPPGTGKSKTVTAAAHEHARLGRKVLVVCSSNKAVDAALTAFLKKADSNICALRFIGGYKTYEARKARDKATDDEYAPESASGPAPPSETVEVPKATSAPPPPSGSSPAPAPAPLSETVEVPKTALAPDSVLQYTWDGLFSPTIEAARQANPENLFHIRKDQAIKKWAADKEHDGFGLAKDYMLKTQSHAKLRGKCHRDNAKELRVLDEKLTDLFLEREVNIIFTTCSSACHQTLTENLKPDIVFIDDAGQATPPDVCMALDPYRESIKTLVLAGDHNQLAPFVTARTSNEAIGALQHSLFQILIKDEHKRFDHIMLTKQYRSNAALMDWSNKQFYDGKIETAVSANEGSPVQRTVKFFFGHLGNARRYKSSPRIGIDVSGDNVKSVPYQNSTSFCNHEEARITVALVRRLLKFNPPEGGKSTWARVEPKHIGIMTPYKGQLRLLRNMLLANGPDTPEAKILTQGQLATTRGIQGSEAVIGIISLCCRDPLDPMRKMKFVAAPNALNVQNTCSMKYQITLGNFKGWCKAHTNKYSHLSWDYYKPFWSLVQHFYNSGDIVSNADVESALLADEGECKKPTSSRFYTRDVPHLHSSAGAKRAVSDKYFSKKKSKTTAGSNTGDSPARMAKNMPVDPNKPSELSNRAKKRLRRAAEEAERVEKAKADAERSHSEHEIVSDTQGHQDRTIM